MFESGYTQHNEKEEASINPNGCRGAPYYSCGRRHAAFTKDPSGHAACPRRARGRGDAGGGGGPGRFLHGLWSAGLRHAHDSASSDGSRALCIACPPVSFRFVTPRNHASLLPLLRSISLVRDCVSGKLPFFLFLSFFLFSTAASGMPHAVAAGGRSKRVASLSRPRRRAGGRPATGTCVSWPALQGTANRPATVPIIWTRRRRPAGPPDHRSAVMIACCRCVAFHSLIHALQSTPVRCFISIRVRHACACV